MSTYLVQTTNSVEPDCSTQNSSASANLPIVTAVIRNCPKSIAKGLTSKSTAPVDVNKAMEEHAYTEQILRKIGLEVLRIEADEQYPDCVFIEDPVFFLAGKAFFPQLGHPTRRGEKAKVVEFVEQHFPRMQRIHMTGEGFMDGGDICYLGGEKKEILCGISQRTNAEGVRQLQEAFPEYTVTPIPIPTPEEGGLLHLITMASKCGPGKLAVGKSAAAQAVRKTIEEKAVSKLEFLEVPDDWAANCIYVNGYVLHCSQEEYPESYKVFQEHFGKQAIALKNKEFDKIDGSLTCRVRLLNNV